MHIINQEFMTGRSMFEAFLLTHGIEEPYTEEKLLKLHQENKSYWKSEFDFMFDILYIVKGSDYVQEIEQFEVFNKPSDLWTKKDDYLAKTYRRLIIRKSIDLDYVDDSSETGLDVSGNYNRVFSKSTNALTLEECRRGIDVIILYNKSI